MKVRRIAVHIAVVIAATTGEADAAPRIGVPAPLADCPAQKVCVWDAPAWRGQAMIADDVDACVDRSIRSAKNDAPYGGRIGTYLLIWKAPGCQGERDAVIFGGESQPLIDAESYSVRGET
jgi:hypothetical protein